MPQPRYEGVDCCFEEKADRGERLKWAEMKVQGVQSAGGTESSMKDRHPRAGWGRNPAGPLIHSPARLAPVSLDTRPSGLQLAWLALWLLVPVSACPLLPRPQQASRRLDSALGSIFSLIELMLLGAPRTHGIARFGSGSAHTRRGREERPAKKLFPSAVVPLRLLLLVSDKPEGFRVGFLN